MKEQNKVYCRAEIKSLFRKETLEFQVETPFFNGRYVNLDNAATTSPFLKVEQAVNKALVEYGSVHRGSGQKSALSTERYEEARKNIGYFVGASDEDNYIVFTKNTTEAINQAATLFSRIPGKVLVSDIEHSSNLLPWLKSNEVIQYETRQDGTIDFDEIERNLKENKVKLLAITGSSNVTGHKPPINSLAYIVHKYGAKILVDACQLVPHSVLDIYPNDHPGHVDFVAFSGHKMYAPYGGGVLIGPKRFFDESLPYQIGGGNLPYITRDLQIKRFNNVRAHDPGTPNFIGAISMCEAAEVIGGTFGIGYYDILQHEKNIVHQTHDNLSKLENLTLYVPKESLSSVIPFDVKGMDSYLVAEVLAQEYGIGVRAGSFCTYEFLRKLKGISDEQDSQIAAEVDEDITRSIPTLVRASFGLINNHEDVERFTKALTEISSKKAQDYSERYCQDEKTGRYYLRGENDGTI